MDSAPSNIDDIYAHALELPEAARAAYLSRACEGDPHLRDAIELLIQKSDPIGTTMLRQAAGLTLLTTPVEVLPIELDRYRLEERIGAGAFGVVYRASQKQPVNRMVAVKVLRPGLNSAEILKRFENERQPLATLDNAHIARIYDAGHMSDGHPYFAMELLNGPPLTHYCDRRKLGVRDRVSLFREICSTVEHAHRRGILHRDLKPSNLLVVEDDGRAVVKVIDFGIARALVGPDLPARNITMEMGRTIGTPQYMSPEQFAPDSSSIDGRSDVYSLGVALYELLTGMTPLGQSRSGDVGLDELRQLVVNGESKPPSSWHTQSDPAVCAAISENRGLDPAKLSRAIRGDLDSITLKCLEKDRADRYETAYDLAADLGRYLNYEPVLARPRSAGYRLRKFVRRHRAAVVTTTAFGLLIALGIGFYIHGIRMEQRRTEAALGTATQEQEIAAAVNAFLTDMLGAADPYQLLGEKVTVLQATQAAAKRLDAGALKDQALVEAAVRLAIGNTFRDLALFDEAELNLRRALKLHRNILPPNDPLIDRDLNSLIWLLNLRGKQSEAEQLALELLRIQRSRVPVDEVAVAAGMTGLANQLGAQGKLDEAEALLRESLEIRRSKLPATDRSIANSLHGLAGIWQRKGNLADAEHLFREAVQILSDAFPADHPDKAAMLRDLAWVLLEERKFSDAETIFVASINMRRRLLPADHPDIARSLEGLAVLYKRMADLKKAEPLYREILQIFNRKWPEGHTETVWIMGDLATIVQVQGNDVEAESLFRGAVAMRRKFPSSAEPGIANCLNSVGFFLSGSGRFKEAEPLFREALQNLHDAARPDTLQLACCLTGLGSALSGQGHLVEAEPFLLASLDASRAISPTNDAVVGTSYTSLGRLREVQHRYADAEPFYREALKSFRSGLPAGDSQLLVGIARLGLILRQQEKYSEAEPLFAELYQIAPQAQIRPKLAATLTSYYGPILVKLGRYEEALEPLYETERRLELTGQTGLQLGHNVIAALAEACRKTNQPDEAARWSALQALQSAQKSRNW